MTKTSFNCTEEKFEAILLRKTLISDSSFKIPLCDWPVMANESVSEPNWTSVQLNLVLVNSLIKLYTPTKFHQNQIKTVVVSFYLSIPTYFI